MSTNLLRTETNKFLGSLRVLKALPSRATDYSCSDFRKIFQVTESLRPSPDGPKNGNFQTPPRGNFIFLIISLGVGKRQTRAVSSKSAHISPFKARSKLLKLFS